MDAFLDFCAVPEAAETTLLEREEFRSTQQRPENGSSASAPPTSSIPSSPSSQSPSAGSRESAYPVASIENFLFRDEPPVNKNSLRIFPVQRNANRKMPPSGSFLPGRGYGRGRAFLQHHSDSAPSVVLAANPKKRYNRAAVSSTVAAARRSVATTVTSCAARKLKPKRERKKTHDNGEEWSAPEQVLSYVIKISRVQIIATNAGLPAY